MNNPNKNKSRRIDLIMVERGLVESREQAQRLIRAGSVMADGRPALTPAREIKSGAVISVAVPERFVSRGGWKLLGAFEHFGLSARDKICLDVGASTGGFTDCLLQHGAARVFAVDVGRGLIHWRLRQDARVTLLEKINARNLSPADLPGIPELATVDVSFISLTKVMPAVNAVLRPDGQIVTLIKPQFEAGRRYVGRGGVVRDEAVREEVVNRIRGFGETELGLIWCGVCKSPITGPAGNVEFLALWKKRMQE